MFFLNSFFSLFFLTILTYFNTAFILPPIYGLSKTPCNLGIDCGEIFKYRSSKIESHGILQFGDFDIPLHSAQMSECESLQWIYLFLNQSYTFPINVTQWETFSMNEIKELIDQNQGLFSDHFGMNIYIFQLTWLKQPSHVLNYIHQTLLKSVLRNLAKNMAYYFTLFLHSKESFFNMLRQLKCINHAGLTNDLLMTYLTRIT
ncbi:hypothetical protein HMI54_004582 [Coelomomyces lativittatus]|nr:hypothetical protein HMI55_000285 [Coelomomyces lativittatus]KAJ1515680.1 hypothetical protein HMI56_002315 [Coelomomyces lativittatus]KAJ1517703.1 hypothetical protein HMI54_004582 [Coelomomyces lativittatus]